MLTALSGVAAISIHGETICTAAGFQRKINSDMTKQWKNVRLLIVDEVSFMSERELVKLQKCLCQLMEQPATRPFGGINIAFCGEFHQLQAPRITPLYRLKSYRVWFDNI